MRLTRRPMKKRTASTKVMSRSCRSSSRKRRMLSVRVDHACAAIQSRTEDAERWSWTNVARRILAAAEG